LGSGFRRDEIRVTKFGKKRLMISMGCNEEK
jgi:hypothetical protein